MNSDEIQRRVKCCTCGGSLLGGEVNFVVTDRRATWQYPVGGNVLAGVQARAISIVCAACADKPIVAAVEFHGDAQDPISHPLANLAAANEH